MPCTKPKSTTHKYTYLTLIWVDFTLWLVSDRLFKNCVHCTRTTTRTLYCTHKRQCAHISHTQLYKWQVKWQGKWKLKTHLCQSGGVCVCVCSILDFIPLACSPLDVRPNANNFSRSFSLFFSLFSLLAFAVKCAVFFSNYNTKSEKKRKRVYQFQSS